ncbi:uncharacterized protein LOC130770964 [Actinidia eriantha]|uniref:uncharacterized protein LOC130770964 n=1 Tax=Actinidia eriantha TaxID=165200 RepID=UPI0025907732|nr:uncharacterized protein LOC130770964 [Actinidia eriantha]
MVDGRSVTLTEVPTVKLLIDKIRGRVIFAESDSEFVDTLLSLLTLSIGTLVRLLSPEVAVIGSITTMYRSISSLEERHLRTPYCKAILVDPRSASEAQFAQLKLNVYPLERAKLYMCEKWFLGSCNGSDWWFNFHAH